jgi:hypothetical protein
MLVRRHLGIGRKQRKFAAFQTVKMAKNGEQETAEAGWIKLAQEQANYLVGLALPADRPWAV